MRTPLRYTVAALLVAIGVLMLFASARSQQDGLNAKCQSYAKNDVRGLLLYTQDYDAQMPPSMIPSELQEVLAAYIGGAHFFVCPATGFLYQPNAAISGQWVGSLWDRGATEVLRDS